ncbi:ell-associated factor Eaf [Plodia interpunctella]|uniref:ell-associated factor Eaf n=1 Tax=Plodia interpunctella TaxID=58824 RepID=UPI00236874D1|nr:ell-associated factor Eaf [Plodia interpunctella]
MYGKTKMADNFTSNYGVRELTLGASFTNNKASQYHTIKYDFKPASVDVNKMATVDVGSNNQVTVTVPHLDGAGVPQTVFKGSQRPYTKECVLIIDKITGEMTLEKLSSNIQVKKTRQESAIKPRPLTPVTADFTNTTQRSTSRTRVTTNRRSNPNSAGPAGSGQNQGRFNGNVQKPAQNMVRSPPRVKTSPPQAPWSSGGNSTLASLPMIDLDDPTPSQAAAPQHNGYRPERNERPEKIERQERERQPYQQEIRNNVNALIPPPVTQQMPASQEDSSSSSSSDSDSNSGSDSDSDDDSAQHPAHKQPNGVPNPLLPRDVLNDDLCLSESGSDSD